MRRYSDAPLEIAMVAIDVGGIKFLPLQLLQALSHPVMVKGLQFVATSNPRFYELLGDLLQVKRKVIGQELCGSHVRHLTSKDIGERDKLKKEKLTSHFGILMIAT